MVILHVIMAELAHGNQEFSDRRIVEANSRFMHGCSAAMSIELKTEHVSPVIRICLRLYVPTGLAAQRHCLASDASQRLCRCERLELQTGLWPAWLNSHAGRIRRRSATVVHSMAVGWRATIGGGWGQSPAIVRLHACEHRPMPIVNRKGFQADTLQ